MAEFLSYAINVLLASTVGVGIDYWCLSQLYNRRSRPTMWWTYFLSKNLIGMMLSYAVDYAGPASPYATIHQIWSFSTAVLSYGVVYHTWSGDILELGLMTVASDLFAGLCTMTGMTAANFATGRELNAGYIFPLRPTTAAMVLVSMLTFLISRRSFSQLQRWMRGVVEDHRPLFMVVTVGLIFVFAAAEAQSIMLLNAMVLILVPSCLTFTAIAGWLLVRQSRELARRKQTLDECALLVSAYDERMLGLLETLDRDRGVLEGHERSLERLAAAGDDVHRRVRQLEESYRRIRVGGYCACPSLDAVLVTGDGRLRARGLESRISVAGQNVFPVSVAMCALSLINLACEVATEISDREGDVVELRIRRTEAGTLLHLEVPASWGRLGAARMLAPMRERTAGLVSEKRVGLRTVVLVMCEEVSK